LHLMVFKVQWRFLEMSPKLLRPSIQERDLIGVIMTLTYTKLILYHSDKEEQNKQLKEHDYNDKDVNWNGK